LPTNIPALKSEALYGGLGKLTMYLGIDIGGTNIHFALVDRKGEIINEKSVPTAKKVEKVLQLLVTEIKNFLPYRIKGVGIAVAGLVNQKKGILYFSPNLSWKNVYLIQRISKYLPNLKMVLENDANAAAWGAYNAVAKKKVKNLICLTLGTGLGSGIVLNGELYRGANGTAGEIGHMTLYPDGLRCPCGNYGCVERYIGANYLVKQVVGQIRRKEHTMLTGMVVNDLKKITPELITEAANRGDKLAQQVWQSMGKNLGIILASVINFLNPEMVVFTGGISGAKKFFLPALEETIKKRAFPEIRKKVKLVISEKSLGVIGAALLTQNTDI